MRIVIIGVGEVGFHVAKALSQEEHDITVMDMVHYYLGMQERK